MPPQAVVAGHICLDLIPGLGSRPLDLRPGELRIAGPVTISAGGSVSNTGLALHRLGVSTLLIALIGPDSFGATLRAALEAESPGLGAGLVERAGEGTSYSVILSSSASDRIVIHFPGANDSFSAAELGSQQFQGAELLHVGYPPLMRRLSEDDGSELERLMRTARQAGLATSLDMAEPDRRIGEVDWPRLLARVLPEVDVFMPSLGELEAMLGTNRPWDGVAPPDEAAVRSLAESALGFGAGIVGIKLGRFGLYLRTGAAARIGAIAGRLPGLAGEAWSDRELWSPIFDVPVRGTTGSGDATIAGFLAAMLERRSPGDALDLACAVGSLCVEGEDALSGIGGRDQAEARARSAVTRPMPPVSKAWRRAASSGVLTGPRNGATGDPAR
ncbi:MAG: carbohydrate kinase family protein [Candidatus Limnocylindrales bacterium]